MKCPIPKWFRQKYIIECNKNAIDTNEDALKRASFVFVDRHYKFAAPFEVFSYVTADVERNGLNIGKFKITCEQFSEGK